MDPGPIEEFKEKRVVDLVMEVGGPLLALAVGVIINLINSILELDPSVLGPVTGTKKVRNQIKVIDQHRKTYQIDQQLTKLISNLPH